MLWNSETTSTFININAFFKIEMISPNCHEIKKCMNNYFKFKGLMLKHKHISSKNGSSVSFLNVTHSRHTQRLILETVYFIFVPKYSQFLNINTAIFEIFSASL